MEAKTPENVSPFSLNFGPASFGGGRQMHVRAYQKETEAPKLSVCHGIMS